MRRYRSITGQGWIGFQRLPGLSNDPIKYAFALEQAIKQQYPAAPVKVSKDEQSNEAILDFVTWPKDQSYMELDVFRFGKSKDGNAAVSIQLASKFVPPKPIFSQDGVNEYERELKAIRDRRQSGSSKQQRLIYNSSKLHCRKSNET